MYSDKIDGNAGPSVIDLENKNKEIKENIELMKQQLELQSTSCFRRQMFQRNERGLSQKAV